MDHLLNLFPFTSTVCEWVDSIFRHTNRDRINISNTLKNWRKISQGMKSLKPRLWFQALSSGMFGKNVIVGSSRTKQASPSI